MGAANPIGALFGSLFCEIIVLKISFDLRFSLYRLIHEVHIKGLF
jgi:hypothetical protein